jgi:metal-responsive CopG/Arc/MetJ family transcriptional regulator
MRTVQMTLDDELLQEIDQVVKRLGTTRSAFTREALRTALTQLRSREMERKHREGYSRQPVQPGEFSDWENEQVWVE